MYLLIALVLQATAPNVVTTPETAATETTAPAPTQQAQTTTSDAAPAAPQTEVRCRWVTPTGQRLRERICELVQVIDDRAELASEATRDMTTNRGVSQ